MLTLRRESAFFTNPFSHSFPSPLPIAGAKPSPVTFAGHQPPRGRAAEARRAALQQAEMLMTIPVLLGVNGIAYLTGLEEPEAFWVEPDRITKLDLMA